MWVRRAGFTLIVIGAATLGGWLSARPQAPAAPAWEVAPAPADEPKRLLLQPLVNNRWPGEPVIDELHPDGDAMSGLERAPGGVTPAPDKSLSGERTPPRPEGVRLEPGELDAEVEAGGASSDITAVVAQHAGRAAACLEEALQVHDPLVGQVALGWTIVEGRVLQAHLTRNTTGSDVLGACMVRSIRSLRFDHRMSAEVVEQTWIIERDPPKRHAPPM